MDFVDAHRADFGVEPICTVLRSAGVQVAPSTYYAARNREPCARDERDAAMIPVLVGIWEDNYRVYGARKLWKAAVRAGHDIGRDQTARLMGIAGIEGARRGKKIRTSRPDPSCPRHPDLVGRDFTATAPNQLWVTDLTFVATWAGVAYVCFITDAFSRMIVGWRVAAHMRTTMVLDAVEMARWSRGITLPGLTCHSDAGSQGGFNWSSQHLVITEVFDGSSTASSRSGGPPETSVAGSSEIPTPYRGGVLGADRQGPACRRSRRRCRRGAGGRGAVVP